MEKRRGEVLDQTIEPSSTLFVSVVTDYALPPPQMEEFRRRVANGIPLSGSWVALWFACHPDSLRWVALERCPGEFFASFSRQFDRQYPDGLQFPLPAKSKYPLPRQRTLMAFESKFDWDFDLDLSTRSEDRPLIEPVNDVARRAYREIGSYSRLVGGSPKAVHTVRAQLLLRPGLRSPEGKQTVKRFSSWLTDRIDNGGETTLTELSKLLFRGDADSASPGDSQVCHDCLAKFGVGFAPDPSVEPVPVSADEPVVLFKMGRVSDGAEGIPVTYAHSWIELCLSVYIAQHTGCNVSSEIRQGIETHIAASVHLTKEERRRLLANLKRMQLVPIQLPPKKSFDGEFPPERTHLVMSTLFQIVHQVGQVDRELLRRAEECYRILGLPVEEAHGKLHNSLTVKTTRHSTVHADDLNSAQNHGLDRSAIALLQVQTERAREILDDVFAHTIDEREHASDQTERRQKPPQHLIPVIKECLTRENWAQEDLFDLFNSHGLMPMAALESLNEWCFDVFCLEFLHEYDGFEIDNEVAAEIRTLLSESY